MKQEDVKAWLKENNRSRAWLAEQCESAVQTVNNWLSTERGIPNKAVLIIERLMEADRLRDAHGKQVTQSLTLEFSSQDFDAIEDAAHHSNKKIRTWATDTLRAMAYKPVEEIHQEIQEHNFLAAEEQKPFGKKPNDDVPKAE